MIPFYMCFLRMLNWLNISVNGYGVFFLHFICPTKPGYVHFRDEIEWSVTETITMQTPGSVTSIQQGKKGINTPGSFMNTQQTPSILRSLLTPLTGNRGQSSSKTPAVPTGQIRDKVCRL